MQRQEALNWLNSQVKNANLIKHMLATEAIMRSLAEKLGKDVDQWGLTGLVHDLDFEQTKDNPAQHSLDTVRFKHFLAQACGVAKQSVSGLVIGAHNDKMLPLTRYASVASVPIIELLTEHQIQQVVNKTRTSGHVIVSKFKTRGSFVAASVVIADIIEAILQDQNLLFSLSVYCRGQYGIEDCCVSLPVVVGSGGVKRILEINLNDKEKEDLALAVETIETVANRYNSKNIRTPGLVM